MLVEIIRMMIYVEEEFMWTAANFGQEFELKRLGTKLEKGMFKIFFTFNSIISFLHE